MSTASLKILVIDDEPPIRKLLRMGLSSRGYEGAGSGEWKDGTRTACQEAGPRESSTSGLPDIDGLESLAQNSASPPETACRRCYRAAAMRLARSLLPRSWRR